MNKFEICGNCSKPSICRTKEICRYQQIVDEDIARQKDTDFWGNENCSRCILLRAKEMDKLDPEYKVVVLIEIKNG